MKFYYALIIFLITIYLHGESSENQQNTEAKSAAVDGAEELMAKNDSPVVALIPVDFSTDIGNEKADIVFNELAVSLLNSGTFQPMSLKKWLNARYGTDKAEHTAEIIDRGIRERLPIQYMCHSRVYKIGINYIIQAAMYPMQKNSIPTYYYRSFTNFYNVRQYTDEIVNEMIARSKVINYPLFDKVIYVDDFTLNLSQTTRSKSGATETTEIPFIKIDNVEYKPEDTIFDDLFMYNLHISNLFTVQNNNLSHYTVNVETVDDNIDYIVTGSLDLNKNKFILSLTVKEIRIKEEKTRSRRRKEVSKTVHTISELFTRRYELKNLKNDYLNKVFPNFINDLVKGMLTCEELNRTATLDIDSHYGCESIYLDDYYISKRNKHNLIVSANGEMKLTRDFIGKHPQTMSEEKIYPIPGEKVKTSAPFFKFSLGAMINCGFIMQPEYNKAKHVNFGNNSETLSFTADEIFKGNGIERPDTFLPSFQTGLGIDFTMESKYFSLTTLLYQNIGFLQHYFEDINVGKDATINNGTNNETITSAIIGYQFNYVYTSTNLNILPSVVLLPADLPVRIYAGIGFYLSICNNFYSDELKGAANYQSQDAFFWSDSSWKTSTSITTGLFPELGLIYKISRFIFKTGIAYNLAVYTHVISSDLPGSNFDNFNNSAFSVKFGFGYYLN